mmetsp:Transcript_23320/g.20700  ORF Transcript_23320/g.20700 Transcript_23320/m.20700 type:complete len:201 (-) Transcript_23320:223-825(-)
MLPATPINMYKAAEESKIVAMIKYNHSKAMITPSSRYTQNGQKAIRYSFSKIENVENQQHKIDNHPRLKSLASKSSLEEIKGWRELNQLERSQTKLESCSNYLETESRKLSLNPTYSSSEILLPKIDAPTSRVDHLQKSKNYKTKSPRKRRMEIRIENGFELGVSKIPHGPQSNKASNTENKSLDKIRSFNIKKASKYLK